MTAIAPPPLDATMSQPDVDNRRAIQGLRTRVEGRSTRGRVSSGLALLAVGALSVAAGAIGGLVNRKPRNKLWYRMLRKPSFTPPDRVFAVVWPVLYASAAVSAWRVWRTPSSPARTRALGLWGAQLACNAAWSPIFFGAHRPKLALVDLGGNFASLGAYAITAAKIDRPAAALVVPYLGWLSFAAAMNAGVIAKNRWLL